MSVTLTSTHGWVLLALTLYSMTFGVAWALWMAVLTVTVLLGFCISVFIMSMLSLTIWRRKITTTADRPIRVGIIKLVLDVCKGPGKMKIDRRMTGSPVIDDVLQELLDYVYRDYINPWYSKISEHQEYKYEIRRTFQKVIVALSNRACDVDLIPYLTTRLVDDFASHIRLYRRSLIAIKERRKDTTKPPLDLENTFFDLELEMEKNICRDQICLSPVAEKQYLREISEVLLFLLLPEEDFHNKIFRFLMREILVNVVLLPTMNYISDPDNVNQIITMPCKDIMFTNECFLTIIRTTDSTEELLATKEKVQQEVAKLRSKDTGGDDDTMIKQQLSSLLFVQSLCDARLVRLSQGLDDYDLNIDKASDLSRYTVAGQKLYSLPFDVILNNNVALPYFIEYMSSIGMQHYLYFYITVEGYRVSAEQQISATLLASSGLDRLDVETLHDAALSIFNQYLTRESSSRLKVDPLLVDIVRSRIQHGDSMDTIFNDVQAKVYDTMQEDSRCFPSFKKSQLYIKLLLELDLIQENNTPTTTTTTTTTSTFATTITTTTTTTLTSTTSTTTTTASTNAISNSSSSSSSSSSTTNVCISGSGSKGSNVSLSGESKVNGLDTADILYIQKTKANSLQTSREDLRSSRESISSMEDTAIGSSASNTFTISANIFNTGICQEHGKSYAVYLISVEKKTSDGAVSKWDVYRRYNDFYDLHTLLQSKFESLSGLILPAKKPFDSVNKEFLERRKVGLNTYLQTLLNPGLLKMHKGLFDVVYHFLEHLHWEREKSDLARRVDSFVNPFRSSVRSVGNMVRSVPNSLADSVAKVRNIPNMLDGVGKILSVKPLSNQPTVTKKDDLSGGKVGASLDFECGEDSIPLHIMLLLLDEIFDLKTRNQWLRRRIVAILQQIAKTMFGDSINRKIIESVAYYTSPDQIAEYLKMFRDSFWPGGRLSEEVAQRDHNTKMRMRVVCKTKLYASLSDELRHLIGSETTRHGVMLVFNMFQQRQLNRRLVYVIFEGLLQTIFPENKFYETFRKLHSQSARIKSKMAAEKDKMTSSLSSSSLLTSSGAVNRNNNNSSGGSSSYSSANSANNNNNHHNNMDNNNNNNISNKNNNSINNNNKNTNPSTAFSSSNSNKNNNKNSSNRTFGRNNVSSISNNINNNNSSSNSSSSVSGSSSSSRMVSSLSNLNYYSSKNTPDDYY